jgi:hypothetical protein
MSGRMRIMAGSGMAIGLAAVSYPLLWRRWCLTWGASADEVGRELPGDQLLPDPWIVCTRAVSISAPAGAIWPWLVQIGSGRAGRYSYDWIENLFGLDMHSADVILPQFQDVQVGDEFPLGRDRQQLRVEILDPERACTLRLADGSWVWILALFPEDGVTRLVSRNRIAAPARGAATVSRRLIAPFIELGSLVLERKMLLGIRDRVEYLTVGHELSAR